ncbi:MAG: hypothetical protein QXM68_00880 [Candidatus Aenigmatarchaeota archaeon]|nr:hypothetical protein [Candidatus Aenigmarchaeota archaeon]
MAKKIKGKDWYTVIAPKFFEEKVLGDTPGDDVNKVIGRKVTVPLVFVSKDMSKYYLKVRFKITKIDGTKALTEFDGLECLRDYIARMVRHRVTRIDIVQKLKTKDEKNVVVKSMIITNKRVTRGIEKSLREFVQQVIEKVTNENTLESLLSKILNDSIKQKIMKEGSKIYPLRAFEIRKMEIM